MATWRSKQVVFGSNVSYNPPQISVTTITNASSIVLTNLGNNTVSYKLASNSNTGSIENGEPVVINSYDGLITETVTLTFVAAGKVEIHWVEGTGGGGGTSNVNIVGNSTDYSTETKQDVQISNQELQLIEAEQTNEYLKSNNPIYYLKFDSLITGSVTIINDFQFIYYENTNQVFFSDSTLNNNNYTSLDDLINALNTVQTIFEFYPIPNGSPIFKKVNSAVSLLGIRSKDFAVPENYENSSGNSSGYCLVQTDKGTTANDYVIYPYIDVQSAQDETNTLLSNLTAGDVPSQYYESSANIDVTIENFKRLDFIADGAISVTILGEPPVTYPFTMGTLNVRGVPIICDAPSKKPVRFQGNGTIHLFYTK